jgi:hypothetical protein
VKWQPPTRAFGFAMSSRRTTAAVATLTRILVLLLAFAVIPRSVMSAAADWSLRDYIETEWTRAALRRSSVKPSARESRVTDSPACVVDDSATGELDPRAAYRQMRAACQAEDLLWNLDNLAASRAPEQSVAADSPIHDSISTDQILLVDDSSGSSKVRKKQNFLDDLSNSGPAVRLDREGRATGPPEDRYRSMEKS